MPRIFTDQAADRKADQHPFEKIKNQNARQSDHRQAQNPDQADPLQIQRGNTPVGISSGGQSLLIHGDKEITQVIAQLLLLIKCQRTYNKCPKNDPNQK
ncbi:hypothetical protein D3C73_1461040 [compost metagenome]